MDDPAVVVVSMCELLRGMSPSKCYVDRAGSVNTMKL
jgi:hypothetical protein